ncbi:uncharacterized protein V6R79_021381 [Siganus canaliculatus]
MPRRFLEDLLEAFRDRLLIVDSLQRQRQAVSHSGEICGDSDIEYSLKMFGWHTDNAGHLLNRS